MIYSKEIILTFIWSVGFFSLLFCSKEHILFFTFITMLVCVDMAGLYKWLVTDSQISDSVSALP